MVKGAVEIFPDGASLYPGYVLVSIGGVAVIG